VRNRGAAAADAVAGGVLRHQQVGLRAPGGPERACGLGEELLLGALCSFIGITVDLRITDRV
ncbi:Mobile element protein, partial [Arthrobacter sp. DR-2P]